MNAPGDSNVAVMGLPGLPISMELVIQIIKSIKQYDKMDASDSQHLQLQACRALYKPNDADRRAWITTPKSVKKDIYNIRLVCKQFRAAAYESLGLVLGDRRFRMTEAGLKDLDGIGKIQDLAPWVRTLTFGCAQMADWTNRPQVHEYLYQSWDGSVTNHEFERQTKSIAHAYGSFRRHHENGGPWYELAQKGPSTLARLLKRFPNLEKTRIVLTDDTEYLGEWLTSAQSEFVKSQFKMCPHVTYYEPSMFYEPDKDCIPAYIILSLGEADVKIKDLRFSIEDLDTAHTHKFPNLSVLPSLRTLRVSVLPAYFEEWHTDLNKSTHLSPFLNALHSLKALENLTLTMSPGLDDAPWDDYNTEQEHMADKLFHALSHTPNLQRVTLEGDWFLSEASLITFVNDHKSSLTHLVLYGCILNGEWDATLCEIEELTRNHLEYISIRYPKSAEEGEAVMNSYLDHPDSGVPHFLCVTDISSEGLPPLEMYEDEDDDNHDDDDASDADEMLETDGSVAEDDDYEDIASDVEESEELGSDEDEAETTDEDD